MCGIVGILPLGDGRSAVRSDLLDRMRDTMRHRGPDGAESWIAPHGSIGLGFRRLAIIDLSPAADQPMSNEDGSIRIVYNGEIYNHAELRRELERLGTHRWKTDHSDTEVILHGFEEWGIECVQRLRGMFAIALWDGRRRELWLVRDRIGVKPLYYSLRSDRLVFASEIKAILEDPEQPRVLDEEALYHYLSFLVTPAPGTLFKGIRKLAPGTWLRVRPNGDVQEHRYWDVWDHTTPLEGVSDDEGADELFCGYPSWKTMLDLQRLDDLPVPAGLKSVGAMALRAVGKDQRREYELLRRGIADLPVFWSGADALTETQKRSLLGPRIRGSLNGLSSFDAIRPIRERFDAKAWERSHLNWMSYADLNLRLPELLLMRVDKMAMGVSLEGRVPFLDHKFVELAMSIPAEVKVRNGTLKYILKKAVRGVIP